MREHALTHRGELCFTTYWVKGTPNRLNEAGKPRSDLWWADGRTSRHTLVWIAHRKEPPPLKQKSRVALPPKSSDLLMADYRFGPGERWVDTLQPFDGLKERPVLSLGIGDDITVEVNQFDSDRAVVKPLNKRTSSHLKPTLSGMPCPQRRAVEARHKLMHSPISIDDDVCGHLGGWIHKDLERSLKRRGRVVHDYVLNRNGEVSKIWRAL